MTESTRRTFLKATGAAVAATCLDSGISAATLKMPIGLQLYTVRDLLPKDFDGTLAKVRASGYTVVEAAGYYHKSATEFKGALDKAGLRCVSTHHAMFELVPRLDEFIAYGKTLGLDYIVCPSPMRRDPKLKGELDL